MGPRQKRHDTQAKERFLMKAIVYTGKGTPDRLTVKVSAKPETRDNEVLVKIHAATVTPSDLEGMGIIRISKLFSAPSKQTEAIPGVEFAGVVEATGKKVRHFKAGDRVFGSAGTKYGAWAEYICLPDDSVLAPIPTNMVFEEAAGICDGALTALHFLLNKAKVEKGQSVLINGASGSVGTYAVQLAKHLQCSVTGVCSAENAELVKSLGADRVIDYNKEDFTQIGQTFDIIFDVAAKSTFLKCKRILKPNGIYLTTVPTPGILLAMLLTRIGCGKQALFAATGLAKRKVKLKALHLICKLLRSGELKSVVDRSYPFEQLPEALRYVEQGHKKGSVIIAA
jgi:NADPH:quinone reductase-like Zn-dependent oxidoreductase